MSEHEPVHPVHSTHSLHPSPSAPHLDAIYRRKVSLIEAHGHDNLAFDSPNRSRKVSAASDHAEMGPVRKKSILHNVSSFDIPPMDIAKQINGDTRYKKPSVTDSVYSRSIKNSEPDVDDDRSWWYSFCLQCRSKESHPAWQPPMWPKLCPYPFCPTYRQFSRLIGLGLIGVMAWCILYAIVGEEAAPPNGRLYQLILLTIAAHIGGWLMSLTRLPSLIGMLFTGVLFQNLKIVDINDDFTGITKELRNVALVMILTRAGLDLDPLALRRLKWTVMKVGLIPWAVESGVITVACHFLLDLPWDYAFLLSAIVAAVSPAVVVPCLLRLRIRGYGVAKGIPTLIIAISGIDDAVSVAVFGIVKSIMFSKTDTTQLILQGPVSIIGGIGFGIIWGVICNFVPEKHDPFMVPLRILMLLVGGMVTVFGSDLIGYGGAGPLGCVTASFMCLVFWSRQGWEIEENPANEAFEIFWMIFEPILFGITGAEIKFDQLDGPVVGLAFGILAIGVVIRMASTVLVGIGCKLNTKEKFFVSIALMSKATVQAALAPVCLGMAVAADKLEEHQIFSRKILDVCIMSIMLTAPLGAIFITILGPKLLTKMKAPPPMPEGWRRSHRPSIRDISIIDEEEERDIKDFSVENGVIEEEKEEKERVSEKSHV